MLSQAEGKIEIVGADTLDDLSELQATAETIFGRGRRTPTWFQRKLVREGVEPELSGIARGPEGICGYALLGRVPSLGGVARGAGVGTIADVRGQGIGRALINFVSERAHERGCKAIEFLAEDKRLDWYLRQGFGIVEHQLTLIADGLGSRDDLATGADAAQPKPDPRDTLLWSWLPEAWARTPADQRATVQLYGPQGARARVWLTREGEAWLAHRMEIAGSRTRVNAVQELALQLRRRLAATSPLLLYPCTANSDTVESLEAAGFETAQRSFVVRRPTSVSD